MEKQIYFSSLIKTLYAPTPSHAHMSHGLRPTPVLGLKGSVASPHPPPLPPTIWLICQPDSLALVSPGLTRGGRDQHRQGQRRRVISSQDPALPLTGQAPSLHALDCNDNPAGQHHTLVLGELWSWTPKGPLTTCTVLLSGWNSETQEEWNTHGVQGKPLHGGGAEITLAEVSGSHCRQPGIRKEHQARPLGLSF